MDNTKNKAPSDVVVKKTPDPLPYVIIFAILFIIALISVTWLLDVQNKSTQCALYPNYWCADNWTCNNACSGNTGISSCLQYKQTDRAS